MEAKTLTISIAAYNVSGTIRECLDSCLACGTTDQLEIIVVDDGATDDTAQIVDEYVQEYPDIVRLVRKENGGYGTTVNTSIALARGTYYKLLDGDDWVDTQALDALMNTLKGTEVDIAISPYVECGADGTEIVDQALPSVHGVVPFVGEMVPDHLSMHSICYKTEIIRASGLRLPEHRLYTDTIYNVVPLQLVRTAFISHEPVYMYRVGQIGQSMSRESVEAHYRDLCLLVHDLFAIYEGVEDRQTLSGRILRSWLIRDARWVVRVMCEMKPTPQVREDLYGLIDMLRSDNDIFEACASTSRVFAIVSRVPRPVGALFRGVCRITRR